MGQGVLMVQVFLGYILLGAFITRFGILFMSKAPCPKVPRAREDQWAYPWNVRIKYQLLRRYIRFKKEKRHQPLSGDIEQVRIFLKILRGKDSSLNGDKSA